MRLPRWPEVPVLMRDWAPGPQGPPDHRVDAHRAPGRSPRPLRASAPVPRRQRPHGPADPQPRARPSWVPARDHVQGRSPRYLAALRRADGGDPRPLGEFLACAILDNLYKLVVPAIAGPGAPCPLPALATPALSANALRVAATRGRLKAARAAGTWRSSRAWVDEYRATVTSGPDRESAPTDGSAGRAVVSNRVSNAPAMPDN
jgi:hypothetical protein